MDFLKSAVASAISKGPAFGFSFGDRVDIDQSIWTLYNGTKREDGSKCSIFSFDCVANKSRLPLARNALRKLRTLRHPGVIRVIDTVETDTYIYIATERLVPLSWHVRRKTLSEETIKWGLFSIAKTMKFINNDAKSVHGALRVSSVFTSESGEWKLGGFDVLSSMNEDDAIIYTHGSLVPDSGRYCPPEVAKSGWEVIKRNPLHAVDAYDYGIFVFEVFNGSFMGPDQAGQTKGVPPSMQASYKNLVNGNPKVRRGIAQFLEQGQRVGGFFQTPLITLTEGIESLGIKSETEREEFLAQLDDIGDDFPEDFLKMKVLPELLKSVEFGGGGPKVFGIVMKIGQRLTDEEYESQITPVIVRLFTLPDRAIRVCLLDNLPLMIDHLPNKIVNDKIFPQMVTGFADIMPVVREQTVRAILTVVPKLSDRTVNGELLRHLAKTANDEQPGIRTNTTICLGKIARNLGNSTRTKVLTAAFARSLRDPFVHARNAGLMALAATADLFSEDDCATKMLPAICPSLVDKERLVRDQANKTFEIYMQRIRKYQTTLPETLLPPPNTNVPGANVNANAPRMGTPAGDAGGWAGWAISSFTNKLATASGQIQPVTNGAAAQEAEAEDFGAAWGDEAEDDPWGEPAAKLATTKTTSSAAFNDSGEPDFAGWLNAQAAAKSASKKPLPKGLAKPTTTAKPKTTASIGAKKSVIGGAAGAAASAAAKKAAEVKKPPEEPKEEEEDEGWGDAWS
ncbi:ARM repeat-containing protein [Rhizodiscina lignyota]|uniref:ARM repeat-containing protein n=1 Tax=Rhizodiscina lignyota TaxID=1504668 RepID=A0A9P4MAN6_9PEZI|nr:ARM repeat-containing protein [Rhizodiscina lignyota]